MTDDGYSQDSCKSSSFCLVGYENIQSQGFWKSNSAWYSSASAIDPPARLRLGVGSMYAIASLMSAVSTMTSPTILIGAPGAHAQRYCPRRLQPQAFHLVEFRRAAAGLANEPVGVGVDVGLFADADQDHRPSGRVNAVNNRQQ